MTNSNERIELDAAGLEALLPCPLCGGAPRIDPKGSGTAEWFVITCIPGCGLFLEGQHVYAGALSSTKTAKAKAIAAWNRRATPQPQGLGESVAGDVGVKPLVWRDPRGDGTAWASTDFGLHYVVSERGWGFRNYPDQTLVDGGIEAAKACAQSDFTTRIRASLAAPAVQSSCCIEDIAVGGEAMKRDDLELLLERVQKAMGPERGLDATIFGLLALPEPWPTWIVEQEAGRDDFTAIPRYTASLDAITALIERELPGWQIACGTCGEHDVPWACVTEPMEPCRDFSESDLTMPLALCAAFLQALIAQVQA